ncbi:amino acid adenylation domain-containing protein [Nocardia pseudovaccinii]|uniref:amino acid adenylation domain-containing protein n=1 Tax=Nocardia pseudovaccinii TaxID=189540 RepID=UPI003D8B49AD
MVIRSNSSESTEKYRPLTAYQRDLMAVASRHPDLPIVQASGYSHIDTAVETERMRRCAELTFLRNDAPRLRIEFTEGELRQRISNELPELEVHDFSGAPDPEQACLDWMLAANRRTITADSAMFRLAILIDTPESFYLYGRMHHAVGDAWTMNLLLGQIITDYESKTPIDHLPDYQMPSYLSFAEREEEYRGSERWSADREWFTGYLDGVVPALFSRTASLDTVRRGSQTFRVDPELVEAIRRTGISIFSVTSAAIAAYLSTVHRTDEIVLGVPMLNRNTPEDMMTAGDFTNMVPLRVRLDGDPTLLQVATRIAGEVRQLKKRQGFAYGDIVRALTERHAVMPTLFDVTYSYSRMPSSDHIERLMERSRIFSAGTVAESVNIVAVEHERDGRLDLHIFESQDVFDTDFPIIAAIRQVTGLLRAALARQDVPIRELDWLPDVDRAALAALENGPTVDFPDTTLDRIFAEQAARDPDAIAVVFEDTVLSYGELLAQADRLAADLVRRGVQRDERIPVVLRRSPDLLIAIYGVLRAGCAYVPIDPNYPADRIATVVQESRARYAITTPDLDVAATGPELTRLTVYPEYDDDPGESRTAPSDLAYVIFTSGSTGRPKGVMVEHRSVVNRLTWMQNRYPLDSTDVILQKTPATFDVSVWELMWWTTAGARVALLEPDGERDPRRIVDAIEAHGVTVMHFVPSMLGPFLSELSRDPAALRRVSTLERVFCSGEALPAELVSRFGKVFAALPETPQLVNLYGPTEATVDVSYFDCPTGATELEVVPIGRPIENITLLILDDNGRRVPLGMQGELNIAGVGVARGYLDRPDLTAAAFVDDPSVPGGRRYRTGDIARWLADGTIEYLGRRDDQVKIRGNRVTLGEVENQLLACPGVRAAAVIDQPSQSHGSYLIGYFVTESAGSASDETVAAHLARHLPAYMVPSRIIQLDEIPLTANGKLDRRALAASGAHAVTTVGAQPRSATERALVELCAQVLGARIGIHDNFFTHGGDSILALALRTAAEQRGLYLDVDVLFTKPTIAELAAHVADHPQSTPNHVAARFELLPLVDRAAVDFAADAFPVTSLQLGMLFHAAERADSTLYKDVFRYRVAMPWRETEFRAAVDRLVTRQPALRSSFDLTSYSIPLQIVHHRVEQVLSVATDADAREIDQYIQERRHFAYDIGAAALFRLRAYIHADTIDLVLSFHHAILDGWSVANLMRSLLQDYLSHIGFQIPALDQRALSSTVLAEYAKAEQLAETDAGHAQYWQEFLAGSNPTALPSALAHLPVIDPIEKPRVTHVLPRGLQAAATRFATEHQVTTKALFLAAHCLALRALTGHVDVTTGVIGHGRPGRADAESVAGLFLNTLPIRLDNTAVTWLAAVEQVAQRERDQYPHRRYPLRAILADIAASGSGRSHGSSVFETAFNFVNYHVFSTVTAVAGIEFRGFDVREETNFPALLTVATDPRDGRMLIRVDGDTSLTREQCDTLAQTCIRMLTCIIDDPAGPIDTGSARIRAADVAQQITDRAARQPDSLAVRSNSLTWTYDEFAERVDIIAGKLVALRLPPHARIGVLMNRRPELIATVVAIAKAGAVCVPLDVNYPEHRLRLMIDRSKPARIIADAEYAELVTDRNLLLDAGTLTGATGDPVGPLPVIAPEAPAYVLFTSGSTGEPKGVVMPHRALANLVDWQNHTASGTRALSTIQYAPLSFDVSFQEIFATLAAGGLLRLAEATHRSDMTALLDTVITENVQRLFLPFVALQAFAETAIATDRYPTGLRVLASSGEQLRLTPEIRTLLAALPDVLLENQYGPTETHVALSQPLTRAPYELPALPPIGYPIDGASVHLLDDRLRPVPTGMIGEIYLGGLAVATGYEGRGGLTAQRFVPAGPNGEIVYRTGDLGFRLATGAVVCQGRADSQVKIRGFRVEPAEVELQIGALTGEFPGIRESAVVAREFGGIDGVLTAFLVGDELNTDVPALIARLRTVLPTHMVPAQFAWLDELPKTPSGKRDDRALREMRLDFVADAADYTPPRDEIEAAVAEIMAEFAGLPTIGADQNFFDAGGTSVGAMRVVLSMSRRWDTEIPLDTFVNAPTAAALAAIVRNDGRRAFDPLVTLQTGNPEVAPLFLVHPIGGNVLCYLPLTKHLPDDRPVYALQAAGADIGSEPIRSMEQLAASYIEAIRRVHPGGPCHLAGWSFGGYVALEISRQLPKSEVASLTLLDTIALRPGERAPIAEKSLMRWFFQELLWYARGAGAAAFDFEDEIEDTDELFARMLAEAIEAGILPADSSARSIRRLYNIFEANSTAARNYRLKPLDRDVTLLRAEEGLPPGVDMAHQIAGTMYNSDSNGWGDYVVGSLDIVSIPGDHLNMMIDPHVAALATTLAGALDATESVTSTVGR